MQFQGSRPLKLASEWASRDGICPVATGGVAMGNLAREDLARPAAAEDASSKGLDPWDGHPPGLAAR